MAESSRGRIWILGGLTPDFVFDAVLKEQHAQELAIPDEPLETGVVVSDHAYLQPAHLAIEAAVSDIAFHAGETNPDDPFAEGDDPFASSDSRSQKAFDLLLALQASAEPFMVQTGLKLYTSMLIASLSADQDAPTSTALIFRAELKRATFVDTKTVTYPPRKKGKAAKMAPPKTDNGQKDSKAVTAAPKDKSIAFAALKSIGAKTDNSTINNFISSGGP